MGKVTFPEVTVLLSFGAEIWVQASHLHIQSSEPPTESAETGQAWHDYRQKKQNI